MQACGLSSATLFDYVFVTNYTAEVFLFISELNHIGEHLGRGMANNSQSYAEIKKILSLPGEALSFMKEPRVAYFVKFPRMKCFYSCCFCIIVLRSLSW